MIGPLAALIEDAIAAVALEVPAAHTRMRRALGGHGIAVATRVESFVVSLDGQAVVRVAGTEPVVLVIRCDASVLDELVRGELDLVDALLVDRIAITGSTDDCCRAADAATAFVQGAVRCAAMPALLARLGAMRREAP